MQYYLKSDNYETPSWAVKELLASLELKPNTKIWCPFHGERGQMIQILESMNLQVVYDKDKDFFDYEPEDWDVIIDNPPFSIMRKIVARALSFKKPVILILPLLCQRNKWLKEATNGTHLTLAEPSKRINFDMDGKPTHFCNFETCWYCWNTKNMWWGKEGIVHL